MPGRTRTTPATATAGRAIALPAGAWRFANAPGDHKQALELGTLAFALADPAAWEALLKRPGKSIQYVATAERFM